MVSGILARRTASIEVNLTDTANVVLRQIPVPSGDRLPRPDFDFHIECLFVDGGVDDAWRSRRNAFR